MSEPALPADLEVRIRGPVGGPDRKVFPVEITFGGDQELSAGSLDGSSLLPWIAGADPGADGERLFQALLADPALRAAWAEARGRSPRRRIHLRIDAEASELHTLPWELLREPSDGGPAQAIAADAETPFSRYLAGAWKPGRPVLDRPIRLLVAIANPTDLPANLPPIDVAAERRALEEILAEVTAKADAQITATFLDGTAEPVHLEALERALQEGPHLFHLVAHGVSSRSQGTPSIVLADAQGKAARVSADDFAQMIGRLQEAPRLIFLASCFSAERSPDDAFRGFAPQLVAAGVPGVLAMQDRVAVETARDFAVTFYRRLLDHGLADLAANEARSALLSRGLGGLLPVLFLRLRDGRLLGRRGEIQGQQPELFWRTLLRNISEGRCTPLLGPGVHQGLLPLPAEIAARLATDNAYPFPDLTNLPRVAQFVSAYEMDMAHREVLDLLARSFRRRYGLPRDTAEPPLPLSATAREAQWSEMSREQDEAEVHRQLADLDLPLYVTTNADNFMALALVGHGRPARQESLNWRDADAGERRERYDLSPRASRDQPVVFHLFGVDDDLSSLVLTEDDHLDYLSAISHGDDNLLPVSVGEALSRTTLLFLGYRLGDLDLKVLLRGFLSRIDSQKWKRLHVAVQVDPQEADEADHDKVKRYLESYFKRSDIDVYWGTSQQFVSELHARWTAMRQP
jgi:hypothetical protein